MKKLLATAIIALMGLASYAQDAQSAVAAAAAAISNSSDAPAPAPKPTYWTIDNSFDLGFNQTGLWNWAAGGYATVNLAVGLDFKANYAKELLSWKNRVQLNYGFLWSADKKNLLQKSTDRIYLESKLGYKTGKDSKWNYSASFDFRSQFSDSRDNYKLNEDGKWEGTLKSGLFSPAYFNIAAGMEWNPASWFNLNLSPLTGGVTVVANEILRPNYSMPKREDETYSPALFQFGAQMKANAKAVINKQLSLETQLVLFADYLRMNRNDWYRINWDNKIAWQAAKFFKVGLDTWLIYDPLVSVKDKKGNPAVQFKEFFSINFTYTIPTLKR